MKTFGQILSWIIISPVLVALFVLFFPVFLACLYSYHYDENDPAYLLLHLTAGMILEVAWLFLFFNHIYPYFINLLLGS